MARFVHNLRHRWQSWLINAVMILVCLVMMIPVATTLLISFKNESDVIRKPPVLLPCDTPDRAFDPTACRWAVQGYERVLAPKPSNGWPWISLTGNLIRTYIPNTLLYATTAVAACRRAGGDVGLCLFALPFPRPHRPDDGHSRHYRRAAAHQSAGALSGGRGSA